MDKMVIIRTIVLAYALFNNSLVLAGYSPLPFENEKVELAVSSLFTIAASLWAWWKDNDVTRKARARKAKL